VPPFSIGWKANWPQSKGGSILAGNLTVSRPLPLEDHLTEVRNRLRRAPAVSLFLDFDGTLTPITEHPAAARLSPPALKILNALAARDDLLVALVSGRALSDLRLRVGIDGIVYAGNHGLEISGRGLRFVEPFAQRYSRFLPGVCASLAESLQAMHGATVENKGLTASVHYRRAATEDVPEIERLVRTAAASADSLFRIDAGKMVWEIVPRTNWDKGTAISWIKSRLGSRNNVSVIAGDDSTDEFGFKLAPEDITIHIGGPGNTAAKYFIASVTGLHGFLDGLRAIREQNWTAQESARRPWPPGCH
jgi:trehalose 6-phosphate phosphatase